MELTPQSVRTASFKTVKKGYDPTEVDSFKTQVASAIETAQNQATAMEARARAAVSKLQELTQASAKDTGSSTPPAGTASAPAPEDRPAAAATAPESSSGVDLSTADADRISRTLLLAQRTADATVADANAEAGSITAAAQAEAARIVEVARVEGRKVNEAERARAESEVQALLARRDFLVGDVDHLEQHIGAQRERLHDAAVAIQDIVERVPGGLAEMRRPLLSASDTPSAETSTATSTTGTSTTGTSTTGTSTDGMWTAAATADAPADDEPPEVSPTGVSLT